MGLGNEARRGGYLWRQERGELEKESRADVPCERSPLRFGAARERDARGRVCNLEARTGSVSEKFYPAGLGLDQPSNSARKSNPTARNGKVLRDWTGLRRELSRPGLPSTDGPFVLH